MLSGSNLTPGNLKSLFYWHSPASSHPAKHTDKLRAFTSDGCSIPGWKVLTVLEKRWNLKEESLTNCSDASCNIAGFRIRQRQCIILLCLISLLQVCKQKKMSRVAFFMCKEALSSHLIDFHRSKPHGCGQKVHLLNAQLHF